MKAQPRHLASLRQACVRWPPARGWLWIGRIGAKMSLTLADQAARIGMLDDDDVEVRPLGVAALDQALQDGRVPNPINPEFGSRPRLREWRPRSAREHALWCADAYDRLVTVIRNGGPEAARARSVVAERFREHLHPDVIERNLDAMRAARVGAYWQEGWRAANGALHLAKRRGRSGEGGAVDLLALARIQRELRPRTLWELFETFALGEPWRHWRGGGGSRSPRAVAERIARAVGSAVVRRGEALGPYLDRVAVTEGPNSALAFMSGLAGAGADPEPLWQAAYDRFIVDPERRDPALLGGILQGVADRAFVERKLDVACADPALAGRLVEISVGLPLDAGSIRRFEGALARGLVPPDRFARLAYGGVTAPVPAQVLATFLRSLFSTSGGERPALEILQMRLFGDQSDDRGVDPVLVELGGDLLSHPAAHSCHDAGPDLDLDVIASVVISRPGSGDVARGICAALRDAAQRGAVPDPRDAVWGLLVRHHARVVLEEIVDHAAGGMLLGCLFGESDDDGAAVLDELRNFSDQAIAWVAEDPGVRAVKLAGGIRYAIKDDNVDALRWSDLALRLTEASYDPIPVLGAFERRFPTGAGWGPFSLRFVRRRPLIAELLKHPDRRVRAWARAAGDRLEECIRNWGSADDLQDSLFE